MKKERIIIYIMCILFLLMGYFLALGFKDSNQCLGNPFIYGVHKLENEETGNISCTCYFETPGYAPFYFNNEKVGVLTDLID